MRLRAGRTIAICAALQISPLWQKLPALTSEAVMPEVLPRRGLTCTVWGREALAADAFTFRNIGKLDMAFLESVSDGWRLGDLTTVKATEASNVVLRFKVDKIHKGEVGLTK